HEQEARRGQDRGRGRNPLGSKCGEHDDHRTRIAGIRSKYSARIKDTRAYYQRQIDVVQNSWKVKYADNVAQLKSKRTREYGFVGNCKSRGEGYINQMPPLVQR
ncbi:MAG: hypothetical protein ACKOFX_06215, partial [Solirubrobacterales bacterium]